MSSNELEATELLPDLSGESGSIVERFERVCDVYPDRAAIVTESRSVSYTALNAMANVVAQRVSAELDTEHCRVALLFSEELPALTATLGILKTGHTYVPLDPEYPQERTSYMLENCGATLLLADADTYHQAMALAPACKILSIEQHDQAGLVNPGKPVEPDSPAYVLFTSGSTGTPKGIVQTHRNLLHHVGNFSRPLGLKPDDRLAGFASICFAASLMDIYGALLNGAALFPHYLKHHAMTGLAGWLADRKISVFHSTPTVFRQLCQGLAPGQVIGGVRVIDLAGEPLYWSDIELYKRHFDDSCPLINRLALTEVQTLAQYRVTHATETRGSLVPVGKIAPGISLLIQDESGNETMAGEVGSIAVRSRYLTPGACDDLQTTNVDPSTERTLYTGDIGYLDHEGHLLHLGRSDSRVKIRGFSIDLAEIEGTLQSFGAIANAAVVVGNTAGGYERLIGYLVPHEPGALTPERVFEHLRNKLPQYMIPAYLLIRSDLPLTANGKIDKSGLLTRIAERPAMTNALVLPRNHTEEQLVTLWEQALGITGIGVTDEFWSLGGDSLIAAELLANIEKSVGEHLPLSSITLFTTIERLSSEIPTGATRPTGPVMSTLREGSGATPLVCIHGGGGDIYRFVELATHLDGTFTVYALQPRVPADLKSLRATVEHIAESYCVEIAKHQPAGPYLLAGYSFGALVAYEMARQLDNAGNRVELLILFDPVLPLLEGFWNKLRRHRRRLEELRFLDRPAYLLSRVGIVRDKILTGFRKRLRVLDVVWRTRRGRALSTERRKAQFALSQLATRRYEVKPYRGDTLLFTSRKSPDPIWIDNITGVLTTCCISCEHTRLLDPPALHEVAEKLNRVLPAGCDASDEGMINPTHG